MKFEELIEKIKTAGAFTPRLVPVVVAEAPENGFTFDGEDVNAYLTTMIAGGAMTVLVQRIPFTEAAFLIEDPTDDDDPPITLDARDRDPELRRFEQYLGQDGGFILAARLTDGWTIRFRLIESWMDEYLQVSEAIQEDLRIEAAKKRELEDQIDRTHRDEIVRQLHALFDDRAFRNLKTQRAMKTYALEKIEGLGTCDPTFVHDQIALLSDRIQMARQTIV